MHHYNIGSRKIVQPAFFFFKTFKPPELSGVKNQKLINMRIEERLEETIGRDPGFRVPDGYFESLSAEIIPKLPPIETKAPARVSTWHRVRPYIYLAAMFAGIWMMMKVFHDFTQASHLSLDNPPQAIAQAMMEYEDPLPMSIPAASEQASDYEMIEEMSSQYESIGDFERDFGYELDPEYSKLN